MKKISLFIACLIATVALVSCDEDTEPRVKAPTDPNFLNTPPIAENFVYDLANCEAVNLTCSQPDYGVAVIPTYTVQISLSEDFVSAPPAEWVYNDSLAVSYVELPFSSTQADMEVPALDVAQGISTILGYQKLEEYEGRTPYNGPVYVRLRSCLSSLGADLGDDNYTNIVSNVIKLNVQSYATVRVPGVIYLVGSPTGWTTPDMANIDTYENWKLSETDDGVGSKVYYGTFNIPAVPEFRFYTALTGWELDSFGCQDADAAVDIVMTDGAFTGQGMKGKGKWKITNWTGGWMKIKVDLNTYNVEFVKVDDPNE